MRLLLLLLLLPACAALDRVPPEAAITAPEQPVAGIITLPVDVADLRPGLASLTVSIDEGPPEALPLDADSHTVDTTALADGPHTITITAIDAAWRPNTTRSTVRFVSDNTPPSLQIASRSLHATPGTTWPIVVRSDEPLAKATVTFAEATQPLYALDDRTYRALRGLVLDLPAGADTVTVEASDALGNAVTHIVPVQIEPTDFKAGGFIRLSRAQKKARKDQAAIDQMHEERGAAYATEIAEALWDGPFTMPTDGARLTSPFGKYRTYSDGKRSFHTGTDLAAPTGTPVHAPAPGRVVLAKTQPIFGNVVIVQHGQGVSTSYNHLSAIHVAPGDTVERGQLLGEIGSTGQSTGPHLHWGLVVGGALAADATEWLDDDFSSFDDFVALPFGD